MPKGVQVKQKSVKKTLKVKVAFNLLTGIPPLACPLVKPNCFKLA
jgi:hypothetical protein